MSHAGEDRSGANGMNQAEQGKPGMAHACGVQAVNGDPVWKRFGSGAVLGDQREMNLKPLRVEVARQGGDDAFGATTAEVWNCQQ